MNSVRSSTIHSAGYDPVRRVLTIAFHAQDGKEPRVYEFAGVSAKQHADSMAAESKGRHFGKHFKNAKAHPAKKIKG